MNPTVRLGLFFLAAVCLSGDSALADPCGMVPPIYPGNEVLITRVGEQRTYVFYKDGVETFLIKPGFSGKVDEFGMLIPFPTPPAIRKVPDNIFEQIQAAIDPPEVVVDLRPLPEMAAANALSGPKDSAPTSDGPLQFDEVRVVRQEAVGMYEVTTLEAGSASALKRWMDDHGYQYPMGMDKVCDEYVKLGWCFVAVKTKVGQKKGVDPKPGQRNVQFELPPGATFDGYVQAMGFRFTTKEFCVPMRLSAHNAGELHNIVYLLTEGPRKIDSMPEMMVRRQVPGHVLFHNLTQPLPLRIIGGTEDQIPDWRKQTLTNERDPKPHNGLAGELFASDLLAVDSGLLALPHEEKEKELLRIGERLMLRGPEIDSLNNAALAADRQRTVQKGLNGLKSLTMTVVDGDFEREVLARDNVRFVSYQMPAERNTAAIYDARLKGPYRPEQGLLLGAAPSTPDANGGNPADPRTPGGQATARMAIWWLVGLGAVALALVISLFLNRKH